MDFLKEHNIVNVKNVFRNLSVPSLVEFALKTEPCRLTDKGALLVDL